jgi:hypothetical protein
MFIEKTSKRMPGSCQPADCGRTRGSHFIDNRRSRLNRDRFPRGMQATFSQSTFHGTHINIRFNPAKIIVAPELLGIKTTADLRTLYSLAPDPAPTVDAFFVDQLDACSSVEPTINGLFAGCAQLPGHIFMEESDTAQLATAPLIGSRTRP